MTHSFALDGRIAFSHPSCEMITTGLPENEKAGKTALKGAKRHREMRSRGRLKKILVP
jgi:hypothetical protein